MASWVRLYEVWQNMGHPSMSSPHCFVLTSYVAPCTIRQWVKNTNMHSVTMTRGHTVNITYSVSACIYTAWTNVTGMHRVYPASRPLPKCFSNFVFSYTLVFLSTTSIFLISNNSICNLLITKNNLNDSSCDLEF